MVDHLFAFEGDGVIKDFPGNYTLYRQFKENESEPVKKLKPEIQKEASVPPLSGEVRRGLSFKEKFEFEQLEKEIPQLQKEKTELEEKMNSGNMDYDALQKAAERIGQIVLLLDEKEMRWLELSEFI
jgi:ATP-binding cassette subfamily F protein uup